MTLQRAIVDIGDKEGGFDIYNYIKSEIHWWFMDFTTLFFSMLWKNEKQCICYTQEERGGMIEVDIILRYLSWIEFSAWHSFETSMNTFLYLLL